MPIPPPEQLVVPPLSTEQVAAFSRWFESEFGVVLAPTEAAARLEHIAQLFLLLGGADWINAKQKRMNKV